MRRFVDGRLGRGPRFGAMAALMIVGLALIGAVVMLLWNWLMPTLFPGAAQIGYWQALGLLLLCKLLLGGGHGHAWHARRHRWAGMTPEERARFEERFQAGWGGRFCVDRRGGAPERPHERPHERPQSPASAHDTGGPAAAEPPRA